MPTFFHGTRVDLAIAMAATPGKIEVTRGGGEFGMGFYTQESKSNAHSWAQNRFGVMKACILQISIDNGAFTGLTSRRLDLQRAARFTRALRTNGTLNTHLVGVDVVIGPLNGDAQNEQQKHESVAAENVLNDDKTTRTVI
jgi:hypothetical protein